MVTWEDKPRHSKCPPPFFFFPPPLYAEHDVIWYAISLWPVWVSCPGYVPSQLPVHLAVRKTEKSSTDCLATTKNMSMLSTLFSSQIQNTALHQLPERKLTLSQLKPRQSIQIDAVWNLIIYEIILKGILSWDYFGFVWNKYVLSPHTCHIYS